jgi:predicted transcriptional regulator
MVNTNKLKGLIVESGYSQKSFAKALGIPAGTFYHKMKRGIFGSDEMQKMVELLGMENPQEIFFAQNVT